LIIKEETFGQPEIKQNAAEIKWNKGGQIASELDLKSSIEDPIWPEAMAL
jgi:hypothetical protein